MPSKRSEGKREAFTELYRGDKGLCSHVKIDPPNERMWVLDYRLGEPERFCRLLYKKAHQFGLGKIVFPARAGDLHFFTRQGFLVEGYAEKYFGKEDGYFLAAYPDLRRKYNPEQTGERDLLVSVFRRPKKTAGAIPRGFTVRGADFEDIPAIMDILRKVFVTYPSPVWDPGYLREMIQKELSVFVIACKEGLPVSVSSAEINLTYFRAELTDCATLPEFQGRGLVSALLYELEKRCRAPGISCLYSLVRASSIGMNLAFHRLGYLYRGTLVNNCNIGGRIESMNLWVKAK